MSDSQEPRGASPAETDSLAPPPPDGDRTQRVRAVAKQAAQQAIQPYLPRPRSVAEVVAAFVSEAIVVGLVAALALTTQDMTFRYLALGIAAARLGVTMKGLGGGGSPPTGPIGAGIVALLGPLFARGAHAASAVVLLACAGASVVVLNGCSATEVRRQSVSAATIATGGNTSLDVFFGPEGNDKLDSLFVHAQQRVALVACGQDPDTADEDVLPCPKDAQPDARAAVRKVREQWAATMRVWTLARVAHAAWAAQLRRCQREQSADAGAACGPDLAQLQATVILNLTAVRCSLRGLGAPDPFPGAVSCAGEKDGGQ